MKLHPRVGAAAVIGLLAATLGSVPAPAAESDGFVRGYDTYVGGLGGVEVPSAGDGRAPDAAEGRGLSSRLEDAARALVGGRSDPAPEQVSAGLAVHQKAPAGKAWPEQKRVRELTDRRTANGRVFELSDGRVQAEISAVPLHYRDAKGRFQQIDTTVRDSDRPGFVKGNATNSFTSMFGDKPDRLVRFERDGRHVELGLVGAAKSVAPTADGSSVTYSGLLSGADVVYEVTPTALKEEIVLRRAPTGSVSYTFTVDTQGLVARQGSGGSIEFVRPSGGDPVLVMPPPFMYDSKDDASSPHGKVFSDKVTQRVSKTNGQTTITLEADQSWLTDPAREYPVVIDPTIRIQPVPTDAQDVQIYSGATGTNYDETYQLKVGTDASQTWRSLVKFPLWGVPPGTQLDDARLEMYYSQTHHTWEYDVPMEARRVTAPWDETTATWANMNANLASQPAGNTVTVDDGSAGTSVVGTWPYSSNATLTPLAINGDYQYNPGGTGDTHTWVPTITESGDYQVDVHFVSESDRPANAPYTVYYNGGSKTYEVDQTTPAARGMWKTLGVHPFAAGTTGKVVLGGVASKAANADAVRFTRWGVTTKKRGTSGVWSSFPVRNVVQEWVNGTQPNYGLMIKAVDEDVKGRGGPVFEASEYAYGNDRRDYNLPKLVLTWGRQGVSVNPPTTVTSTGALLDWPAYQDPSGASGDDIVEYQVHRSVYQTYTPSAATLIAPVPSNTRSYQDTTATPTAADETDPLKRQFYYYMVAVKTADGKVIPGPTQSVTLPKAGQTTRIYRTGVTDTTLSAAQPTVNVDSYAGDPYLSPGNNSTYYGDTRALVKFPDLAGVPSNAQVVSAQLRMWNNYLYPGTDTEEWVDVHRLTRGFAETTATWNNASSTTPWTTPGGDYDPAPLSGFNGFTNDPEWETWEVKSAVTGWLANPATNHGLLLRMRDEAGATARALLLSSEGQEPLLRPTLEVTYLEPTAESTYYAPTTPGQSAPATAHTVPVTVSNPTQAPWNATDWELSYKWTRADGSPATDASNQVATALPRDIGAGETVDIAAQVRTPASTVEGNKRTDYVLKWELHNKGTGKWLSETTPIQPLAQNVAVVEPTSDQLGLEKFYSYAGKSTGAGGTLMNNLYAGNTVWSYDAFSNPSRGLTTFVRLAYNSLDTSDTVAGYGWSLQASSLMRLGSPLDFHPNPNPTKVTLTDGDGTSHWFSWDAGAGQWVSPKGVHLHLQRLVACDNKTQESRAWQLTRPDRTKFFYDCDGYLSAVVDNNLNELMFTYEERKSNNKPTKFLKYLTDPAGRVTLTIDYYAKGQAYDYIDDTTWTRQSAANLTNPKIIDHVSRITDISGRALTFTYTDKGLLGELVDGAGSTNGTPKVFKFAYDMTQGNKNVKLVKVTDPRGGATNLAYYSPPQDDPKFHWRTKTYTDRLGHPTQFAYTDPDGPQGQSIHATVTDAESRVTSYVMDGYGRPTQTANAKNQVAKLGWDDDHNVIRLEEADGAVSTWRYDPKTGYPLEIKDAEAVKNGTAGTILSYQYQLNGHVAELTSKTSPEGRKWTFGYTTEADLAWVVDPVGNTTPDPEDYKSSYTYDDWGQLLTATDGNGNVTTNSAFHASGYPKTITDALNNSTKFEYDDRGQVLAVTDALSKRTTQTYDTFGRALENRVPKRQDQGQFIVTPAPVYDPNDNVVEWTAPNGATSTAVYGATDKLTASHAPVDESGAPQRKTTYTYDKVGNLLTITEPKGNLTPEAGDYVTTQSYDEIYQLISVTNAEGDRISYGYDNVGNVVTVVDPRKNATPDPADYTTKYEYDLAHRVTRTIDALGKNTTQTYDKDGLVTATTDQLGNTSTTVLDPRGMPAEVRVPHKAGTDRITRYEYDQVGNQTKVISPRGVATTDDPDDFATVTIYDALNRVKETHTAYDKDDARYRTADKTTYSYDAVGRLTTLSAPPSSGESVRNDTTYTYFDNGWTETSSDPWGILTTYDYNELGAQTARTLTSAGGSASRTMTWAHYPDGKLKSRADDGVPVGSQVVLVDNSDFNNTNMTGTWTAADTATGKYGHNYQTRPAGSGSNTFNWRLSVPQDGTYEAFVRYPQVSGAAGDARYTVTHENGSTVRTVDQSTDAGAWVSLGSYSFTEGADKSVSLSDEATGTVVADAVKLVRDNTGEADNEKQDYTYTYDPNGNLTTITDASPGTLADKYTVTYTGLNQVQAVKEFHDGAVKNLTTFAYNSNGAPLTVEHDKQYAEYGYDARDLVSMVTNGTSAGDPDAKVTRYTYTDRGEQLVETKGNGNTVEHTYYLDGLPHTQTERKPNGTLVSEHVLDYDLNSNRIRDAAKTMNADNHAAYLTTTSDYTYDPRDRVASLAKTGDGAGTETYVHDANNNVINQTVDGVTTTFNYDRNRLLTTTAGGATMSYNYDPFGRLDTVTSAGTVLERNVYDGFDHIVENRKTNGGSTVTTRYTFDPLDRTSTKTSDAGTAKEKTTTFNYLGLSKEVLDEEAAGRVEKSYQYSPWGQRLSQVTHNADGSEEDGYYGYNLHTDVEQLSDESGDTKATYGYTAYGSNDEDQFTGIDKPDTTDPTKEPYNAYRFNAKRWDQASGSYDMGFRDYSPGLNRFLTRDSYNGALADMRLGLNPFTGNRYAFGGGNPISMIELDGHRACADDDCTSWVDPNGRVGGTLGPMDGRTATPLNDQDEHPEHDSASVWDHWLWGESLDLAQVQSWAYKEYFCSKGEIACEQWEHWLGGSGEDLTLDPALLMVEDNFSNDVNEILDHYRGMAVEACGTASSCTFSFSSGWDPTLDTKVDPVTEDIAGMGQVQLNVFGSITVNRNESGDVSVSGSYQTSIFKAWNFDEGEYPSPHGVTIPQQLEMLHEYGFAQDFYLRGTSAPTGF